MTATIPDSHDPRLVRVVRRGRFSISVYADGGQRHHLPHRDVHWNDGEARVEAGEHEVVLPRLERIVQGMGHELGDFATSPGERLVVPGYETP